MKPFAEPSAIRRGANRVLTECIPLKPGDRLTIFFDEPTTEFAEEIRASAKNLNIITIARFVPQQIQSQLVDRNELVDGDEDAIRKSRAIIISFGSNSQLTPYRRRLLNSAIGSTRFVAVLPNATPQLLAYGVDIDYDTVERKCNDLAVAMMAGDHAEIITGDSGTWCGRRTLHAFLGRYERPPITSTGIVQHGAWGNVPGGETFIAPLEKLAHGEFVLNGAFRGVVIDRLHPLLLSFESGELVHLAGPDETLSLLMDVLGWVPGVGPKEPLQLAELGIGVNDGLHELTGNALFDEKMSGTLHIAVGENAMYGGKIRSPLHEDLVSRDPDLIIDGYPILKGGQFVLNPMNWRESISSLTARGGDLPNNFRLARSSAHGSCWKDEFRISRDVGMQRVCSYTIGDLEVGRLLCRLWPMIPVAPNSIPLKELISKWSPTVRDAEVSRLRGLISILAKHRILEYFEIATDAEEDYMV